MRAPGKRVWRKPPWVRIPPSPPRLEGSLVPTRGPSPLAEYVESKWGNRALKEILPAMGTGAIVLSGIALSVGYIFIRRRLVTYHHRSMIVATAFAALFLILYIIRVASLGFKPFAGQGIARQMYFLILIPHTILAAVVGPLVLITLYYAIRSDLVRHRRLARVTFPLWLFVAASGWMIYLMLYVLY